MPYNPGVQSIAAQLHAQGMGELGKGISDMIRNYTQNKIMASQATGKFEGALQANPELFQMLTQSEAPAEGQGGRSVNTDIAKAFNKLQKDGALGVKDAALLAQFADTYGKEKQEQQMMQLRQQQAEMARQQAEFQKFQMQEAQRKAAEQKALNERLDAYIKASQQANPDFQTPFSAAAIDSSPAQRQPANPYLAEAAMQRQAFGRPASPESTVGAITRNEIAGMQTEARTAIENAKRTAEQAKLEARTADPVWHTDPETGYRAVVYNGQVQFPPGQITKDPALAEIEKLQKAGKIKEDEAVRLKLKYLDRKSSFSPTPWTTLRDSGIGGVGAAHQQQPAQQQGPRTPQELIEAVRAGRISAEQAKALAEERGWK